MDSNHLGALNNLGILLKNFEQYEQAIKCLEKSILLKDDYSEAINNLGNVLMEMGNDDRAIACYKKVINIEPNKINAYLNLLDAYENINNTEGLESLINEIKVKFPNLEQNMVFGRTKNRGKFSLPKTGANEKILQFSTNMLFSFFSI